MADPKPPAFDPEKNALVGYRKPGRPRKLTPEVRELVLNFLTSGLSRRDACKLVGISRQTLTNEIRSDPGFKLEVHRAELQAKLGAAACVTSAAQTDPKIALEFLQRRWPNEWGKRPRAPKEPVALVGKNGREVRERLMGKLAAADASVAAPVEASPATVPAETTG